MKNTFLYNLLTSVLLFYYFKFVALIAHTGNVVVLKRLGISIVKCTLDIYYALTK